MINVYLAGPSAELPRVLRFVEALEATPGVAITYAWWKDVQAQPSSDGSLPRAEQVRRARADLAGVRDADVVWLLWPETSSLGVPVEFGYALGLSEASIIVSGQRARECIFTSLRERFTDDLLALDEVRRRASHWLALGSRS